MGYGEAVGAVAELADLEQLGEQLGQGYFGATLDDVDVDGSSSTSAPTPPATWRRCASSSASSSARATSRAVTTACGSLPRAVRRLGETALKRVFERRGRRTRDHDDRAAGQADEPTGLSRQWEFGDELPIDTVRTVSNALQRSRAPERSDGPRAAGWSCSSRTSRWPRRSGARWRRSRCASTCRSR